MGSWSKTRKKRGLQRCAYVCYFQERSKGFCNFVDVNTWEYLKAISELSRYLYENCTEHEEGNAFEEGSEIQSDRQSHLQDESFVSPLYSPTVSSDQTERVSSSSGNVTSAAEKSPNAAFMHCHPLANPDRNDESLDDTNTATCPNSDAKVLGTKLFEEGKIARSYVISQIQEGLRKREIPKQINSLQSRESSSGMEEDLSPLNDHLFYNASGFGPSNNALVKPNPEHALRVDPSSGEKNHVVEAVRKGSSHRFYDNDIKSESQQIISDELQNEMTASVQELPLKVGFPKDSTITAKETYFDATDGVVWQRKARDDFSKATSGERQCTATYATTGGEVFLPLNDKEVLHFLEAPTIRDRVQHESTLLANWEAFPDNLGSDEHDNASLENWTTPPESVSNGLVDMNEWSLTFEVNEEMENTFPAKRTVCVDPTKSIFSHQVLDCDVEADCHTNPSVLQDEVISEQPQNNLLNFSHNESQTATRGSKSVIDFSDGEDFKGESDDAHSFKTKQKLLGITSSAGVSSPTRNMISGLKGGSSKNIEDFSSLHALLIQETEGRSVGLHPEFVRRHSVTSTSKPSMSGPPNRNLATWDLLQDWRNDSLYSLPSPCRGVSDAKRLRPLRNHRQRRGKSSSEPKQISVEQDESWHFPPLPENYEDNIAAFGSEPHHLTGNYSEYSLHLLDPSLDPAEFRSAVHNMRPLMPECVGEEKEIVYPYSEVSSVTGNALQGDEGACDTSEDSIGCLLGNLELVLDTNLELWASSNIEAKPVASERTAVEKFSVEEQTLLHRENENNESSRDTSSSSETALQQQSEQSSETVGENFQSPVQETPRPLCGHYHRRCLVRFPCCNKFYPCHRCHNESDECSESQSRAANATHMRCSICYNEQEVRCILLSVYYCFSNKIYDVHT